MGGTPLSGPHRPGAGFRRSVLCPQEQEGRRSMINPLTTAAVRTLPASVGVPRQIRAGLQLAGQLLLLVALFYAGAALVRFTGVPLPGNLVGMLLLLAVLRLGIVRLEHIQDAAA